MARIKPQALLQQSKKKKAPSRISLTTIILFSLIVFMVVFFIFSAYRHFSHRSVNPDEPVRYTSRKVGELKNIDVPKYAIIQTSKGAIAVELFKDGSPEIVDEFIELCQKGHFKGMQFHRVIKHYVIQAGDIHSIGPAEQWTLKGKHYSQLDRSVKHEAFMLGTSKSKHDSKGFELYITTAPIPDLNEKITVFGRVTKGEEVVQEIEEVDTDDHYVPKSAIGIMDVTLEQKL
ncbi:peptidyl-prolyl cis-trans isomerase CYP21-4-like isoform X1 [Chenopodium quinoa]|uniref:Peptidyl-prolyl cis-trans isomerase n=1 Tax=Chenopodium quinoa TaxID=63459 RepID=A0A803M7G0_CHEQI|nr:peptidyl-prolyl cis-trans isomerase CYP21-4-like isoform X1 [Chenopodium quinoa]XP_021768717.1 peptidyl-prolyl cis-trans isomerase CYP21-4-like isoform X1 [Chenopodium quinoa]